MHRFGWGMRQLSNAEETFDDQTFPTTTAELIENCGETELELQNGNERLGDVLERVEDEELDSPEDAMQTTYGALGEEAIGRKGYSDRDPTCPGEDREPLSL